MQWKASNGSKHLANLDGIISSSGWTEIIELKFKNFK